MRKRYCDVPVLICRREGTIDVANSVSARWHGDDYQARFFWYQAAALKDPDHPYVVEVSYEADGPKAFDDVIVRYDPARVNTSGPERISADFHQIKFHVVEGGRFGFADLVDPAFIGATRVSILERLREAKATAPANSAFTLITTDRPRDDDPLADILSNTDGSLRWDKLSMGGNRSRMGKVRLCWRNHLGLASDDDLRTLLANFHIKAGYRTLDQLREEVNLRFQIAGLKPCVQTTAFVYDDAARKLKAAQRYTFTRDDFAQLCVEEGWVRMETAKPALNVALRSFSDGPNDRFDATADNTLNLVGRFDGRALADGVTWSDLEPDVRTFLRRYVGKDAVRLFLDAHASFAFLAGDCLGLKTGVVAELVQKGRAGTSIWRADDGQDGPDPILQTAVVGTGPDIALVLSLSRNAMADVRTYVEAELPSVGRILDLSPTNGPRQSALEGGAHAARIADAAAEAVKSARLSVGATVHIFVSGPNAAAFFMGQHASSLGRWQLYEFDFSRRVDGSYSPSFAGV